MTDKQCSGGVAILWKPHLAITMEPVEVVAGRVLVTAFRTAKFGDITVASVYGHVVENTWISPLNENMMQTLLAALMGRGKPFVV